MLVNPFDLWDADKGPAGKVFSLRIFFTNFWKEGCILCISMVGSILAVSDQVTYPHSI